MTKYFVWITGLRGPEAQIWSDNTVNSEGKAKPTLFKVRLPTDMQDLSLNVLMILYEKDRPNDLPQN
jgi:hypothetical protein